MLRERRVFAPTPALPRKRERGHTSETCAVAAIASVGVLSKLSSLRGVAPSPACGGRLGWGQTHASPETFKPPLHPAKLSAVEAWFYDPASRSIFA